MIPALAALVVATGLTVWARLIGVASEFAAFGVTSGLFEPAVLTAAGSRIANLLRRSGLPAVPTRALLRAFGPFVAAQMLMPACVLTRPEIVHWLDEPAASAAAASPHSDEEVLRRMRELAPSDPETSPQ